jgi:[ribosomal protein S18]-alanine N-acetyltransferase
MKRLIDRVGLAGRGPSLVTSGRASSGMVAASIDDDGFVGAEGVSLPPLSSVDIEPMKRRHLRQILVIEQQVYPRPWTLGIFHGELDGVRDGHRLYVVAKSRGEIVGYGGLLFAVDDAHITNVAVDPRQQRRGVGRLLMLALCHGAIAHGSLNLSLEVRVSNTAAQEMYRRFGFAPAGVRPRYYENVEDAIIMWCHDIDTAEYAARLAELAAAR